MWVRETGDCSCQKSVGEVYELVFTEEEKLEYTYTDFLSDVDSMGKGAGNSSCLLSMWSLEDTLRFLREMQ